MEGKLLEIVGVCLMCLGVSALDSLRDAHVGDSLASKWRRPFRVRLGILTKTTDLWHLCKWGAFYTPLVVCLTYAVGAPWGSWAQVGVWIGTGLASWGAWRAFSPWGSFWLSGDL